MFSQAERSARRPVVHWAMALAVTVLGLLPSAAWAELAPRVFLRINEPGSVLFEGEVFLNFEPGEKAGTYFSSGSLPLIFAPDPEGGSTAFSSYTTPNTGDVYQNLGGLAGVILDWDIATDADPFVTGSVSILNFTGVDHDFYFTFVQPVAPALGPGTLATSSFEVSVQDVFNTGGATLSSVNGEAIFQPGIDGTPFTAGNLLASTSITSANSLDIQTATGNLGPIPTGLSSVDTELNLTFKFNLTNLDQATGSGRFEVVVPELGSGSLLALAFIGAGLVGVARRRS